MEFTIFNTAFEAVAIIDSYISAIWTDRYDESGDFEICMPMNTPLLDCLQAGYYVMTRDSDRVMFIEDLDISTDVEDGSRLIVTGRSLEQLIDRRIVLNKTTFEADDDAVLPNLQNGIKKLLDENVINPAIAARRIDNFIFEESTDEDITKLTIEAQYFGDNLYEVVKKLCQEHKLGFKVTLNENNQFVFKLYKGADRSYEQFDNPYVVFSPDNDNLFNSSYYRSKAAYKNVAIVAGEIIDHETETTPETRTMVTVTDGTDIIGLTRREVFVDSSGVSTDDLNDERYRAVLKMKGIDALIENLEVEAFEGEVEATVMYKYGEDFFIGDIVQLVDEYGHEGKARVSEFVLSQDESGIAMYPTFTTIQEGEYDYE